MPKKAEKKKPKQKREKAKKETRPKAAKPEIEKKEAPQKERYFEATGRRKTSIARVRLFSQGEKTFLVNGKPHDKYFPTLELKGIILSPLDKMNCLDRFGIEARVKGGGLHSQAEAVRHGMARALVLFNAEFKKRLKKVGFLTRDPRMRERKKFGLKRARRAPQWQKR